jgi:hypothetical protein
MLGKNKAGMQEIQRINFVLNFIIKYICAFSELMLCICPRPLNLLKDR